MKAAKYYVFLNYFNCSIREKFMLKLYENHKYAPQTLKTHEALVIRKSQQLKKDFIEGTIWYLTNKLYTNTDHLKI